MAFSVPANGSRGTRQPQGRMVRGAMRVYAGLYRLLGGAGVGPKVAILTTVGAKSGEQRTAAAQRFPDGDRRWIVVGAAGGAASHPAWVYNMAHDPDHVWIQVGRERFKVRPELLEGEARTAAWERIVHDAPSFGDLTTKTDREMPVIRLTAVD